MNSLFRMFLHIQIRRLAQLSMSVPRTKADNLINCSKMLVFIAQPRTHMERTRCQIRNYLLCFEFNCFPHTHTREKSLLANEFSNFVETINFSFHCPSEGETSRGLFRPSPSPSVIRLYIFNWKSFINFTDQTCFEKFIRRHFVFMARILRVGKDLKGFQSPPTSVRIRINL